MVQTSRDVKRLLYRPILRREKVESVHYGFTHSFGSITTGESDGQVTTNFVLFQKLTLREIVSCPISSRMEKVYAEKLSFLLVPNIIQLAPKQKRNSQHDPIPSNLKGNSNCWKQYRNTFNDFIIKYELNLRLRIFLVLSS